MAEYDGIEGYGSARTFDTLRCGGNLLAHKIPFQAVVVWVPSGAAQTAAGFIM